MNFKHLYYFWATAKAGGIVRAGEQLHVTPQTLSGQVKLLESRLGCSLLRKSGRRLELTDAGRTALRYADQIFALGSELESVLGSARRSRASLELRVGIADAVPKSIAYRLLEPSLALDEPVHLVCREGPLQDLLAQLSVHRLDLVISDEALEGGRSSVKAFSHPLGTSSMSFFATPALKRSLGRRFPDCLDGAPMLIQGAAGAMRQRLDLWLAERGLHPRRIGEFDDAALMKAFGGEGRGVFMSPAVLESETCAQYRVKVLGCAPELVEAFFAISVERQLTHPCVVAITQAAHHFLQAPQAS